MGETKIPPPKGYYALERMRNQRSEYVARNAAKNRNTESAYNGTEPGVLSFDFKICKEAGLPFAVAEKIIELTEGYRPLLDHLVQQDFQTPEAVESYIKSIGCWADTTGGIIDAMCEHLDVH